MWFYKIDGVLDGFTFPEDRGTRSRAAQEFQSKQTLFSKSCRASAISPYRRSRAEESLWRR